MSRSPRQSIALYAAVSFVCLLALFPLYWMVITAIAPPEDLRQLPPVFWPRNAHWSIFSDLVANHPILHWLGNSLIAAIGSVCVALSVSIFAGYSLSRFHLRGSHTMGLLILTVKMLPATLLIIPLFVLFRAYGLIGSTWSIIIAHSTLTIPFTTWMLKGYFDTIPRELEQAAMIDGCSPIGALFRVVLPISTPGLAATALYGFILSWSDYVFAQTFLTHEPEKWTANLGIASLKGEFVIDWNQIFAASILVALPIIVIYLLLERYLVGGLTAGAEK